MVNRIIRNLLGLIAWIVGVIASFFLNAIVVVSNYLGCKASFELLGFEMRALGTDELLGGILGALLGDATIAHLFALGVALTVALGLFMLFRLFFSIYKLYCDRHAYIVSGDEESAKVALLLIVRDAALIVIFAIPLIYAMNWDIGLFRYRCVAGALGVEDPSAAANTLKIWELQLEEHGSLFAWSLARFGAWGYLAVTAIACLCLEFCLVRVSESWVKLCGAFEELTYGSGEEEQFFHGYDEHGRPVYDPNTLVASDTTDRPIADQSGVLSEDLSEDTSRKDIRRPTASMEPMVAPSPDRNSSTGEGLFDSTQADDSMATQSGLIRGELCDPVPRDNDERTTDSTATPHVDEEPREVIGGEQGESVSMADALADPQRYWVDPETRQVWDTDFRRQLLGDNE